MAERVLYCNHVSFEGVMNELGDDHLSRAQTELGEPEAIFRISRGRYIAKLWVGIGLIVGSSAAITALIVFGLFDFAGIFAKFILAPPFIGIAILYTMYRQRGLTVLIYPTGLLRLQRGQVDSFPWEEITEIRIKVQRLELPKIVHDGEGNPSACWLPVEVPSIQIWKSSLVIERHDGNEAYFGPALADYGRLAELVQRRTFPRAWEDARDRWLAGEVIAFGDLEVAPSGLRHNGKRLRWRDFKELAISQGRLSVKKLGGWLPWAVLDVSKIGNPHILFTLVGEARRYRAPAVPQPE
jgi:hypothetical protein